MKKAKTVFIIILLVLEGIMALDMTVIESKDLSFEVTGSWLSFTLIFCSFAVVSFAELIRIKRGKENILFPMFFMKAILFAFAFSLGTFADYSVSRDNDLKEVGILFAILAVALLGHGIFFIKYMAKRKAVKDNIENWKTKEFLFLGFDAEWYFDDVLEEYLKLNEFEAEKYETDGLSDEANDQIFVYACNRIAYLFVWLLKRNGLKKSFLSEYDRDSDILDTIRNEHGNPSEFIYGHMDGKLINDDVEDEHLAFMHTYYEEIGSKGKTRGISYTKDYEEIVLGGKKGNNAIAYCLDFSWDKYRLFEERMDKRYEEYQKKQKREEIKPPTEKFFINCPLYVHVFKPGYDEENGDEPTELTGHAAYEFIEDSVRAAICEDFRLSELHKYYSPSWLVFGFSMDIIEDGLAVIKVEAAKGISDETKDDIRRFIDGQMSDDWGEGSERYFVNDDENNESYEVYFWKYEG